MFRSIFVNMRELQGVKMCTPHWRKPFVIFVLLTAVFVLTVFGHPLEWRNIHLDVEVTKNDSGWNGLVLWSNDAESGALSEVPVLTPVERSRANLSDEGTSEVGGKLKKAIGKMLESERSDHQLAKLVDKMLESVYIKKALAKSKTKISCRVCRSAVGIIMRSVRRKAATEEIYEQALSHCVTLKLKSEEACEGILKMFGDRVIYALQKTKFGAEQICGFLNFCEDVPNHQAHNWTVNFPTVRKPPVTEPDSIEVNQTSFKVLQISDTHLDPYYQEGTNAKCDEMLCCRASEELPKKPENRAGRWGDYRKCDTPRQTLDHMLQHISSTHSDIDYILWTGDLNPHDLWKRTREDNLDILQQTVAQINSSLPGVPVFAALGNHDSWPPYSFPPPFIKHDEYNSRWLYEEVDKQWRNWLPVTTSKTILRGGFYSVLVRPGFRIISLNMNFCLRTNWWLFIMSEDPADELQWLIYELQSAEFKKEKVHIIGHVPPGHPDCLKTWSHIYYRIIGRYESTVSAQFFGHTHFDEFELFYDPDDLSRPVSVAFTGPSVTPFTGLNPGYKIYYIDGDHVNSTRTVLDFETWVMHLDEANQTNNPVWYKLYSAKDAYQLSSFTPEDWHNFVVELEENKELFHMFYKHYWKNSSVRPFCDIQCKEDIICDLRSGRSQDRKTLCKNERKKISKKKPLKKVTRSVKKTLSTCVRGYVPTKDKPAIEDS